jgi:type VI secretion system protein
MPLTLRFQSSGRIPGRGDPVRMRGRNLTVGRGPANDLVLPDPDRTISTRHLVIEEQGDRIVVLDLSSNGTFLNYGKVPLGAAPTKINDGDVLCVGPYELVVDLSDDQHLDDAGAAPLPQFDDLLPPLGEQGPVSPGNAKAALGIDALLDGPGGGGDFLDDLLGARPQGPGKVVRPDLADDGALGMMIPEDDPLLPGPVDANEGLGGSWSDHSSPMNTPFAARTEASSIPDDWDLDLPGAAAPNKAPAPAARPPAPAPPPTARPADPFAVPLPEAPAAPLPVAEPVQATAPPVAAPTPTMPPVAPAPVQPAPPAPVAPAAPSDIAARAFLDALGAADLDVPDAELEATMRRLGAAMRVMVEGLREVLMTRSAIKSEFRIAQTRISSGGNNPLKFSVSPDQAIEAMVRTRSRGYLDAQTAAQQALDDIKAHELAVMTGMEAALRGILGQLDPKVLEGRIEVSAGIGSLLKGRKARYWEVYEKMYAEISNQAETEFQELFSREFATAYQEQLERLK